MESALERVVMKPVHIEFAQPRAWKFLWPGVALVLLTIGASTGVKWWQLHLQRTALEQQTAALQAEQLQHNLALENTKKQPNDNPRAASEAAANRLLKRDWNQLYDAIESPTLAKVRLVRLNMDAFTGQAVLEFEFDTMEQAAEVTHALALSPTAGTAAAWQLERLEKAVDGGAAGAGKVRGFWRKNLD